MNSERKDTDRMLVFTTNDESISNMSIIDAVLFFTVNLVIAITGIYYIPKILRQIVSYLKRNRNLFTVKEFKEIFWATVIVSVIVNITCTAASYFYIMYMVNLVTYCLIIVVEMPSIWFSVKDLKIVDTFFGCSNRYLLRAIHTLAVCHILWFLHRMGCNLLVATFFIALAPTQTLAAISLIYLVVISSTLCLSVAFHYFRKLRGTCRSYCSVFCKICVLFVFYTILMGFLVFLTVLFNELNQHGLTSSGLGSVILSLVAPTVVFIITLRLKKHVQKYFSTANPDSNEDDQNEESNREQVTVDIEQPTVNTPLLAN